MEMPNVEYARSGEVAIAYQVFGEGPVDLVFARGFAGDLLTTWEQPLLVHQIERFASMARVLMLDKRGTGLSDGFREPPTLETRMDDLRLVMGRRRVATRRALERAGQRRVGASVRSDVSGAHSGTRALRPGSDVPARRRLPVGADRRGMAPAACRRARVLGHGRVLPSARGGMGAGASGRRRVPGLVRAPHASQPQ